MPSLKPKRSDRHQAGDVAVNTATAGGAELDADGVSLGTGTDPREKCVDFIRPDQHSGGLEE